MEYAKFVGPKVLQFFEKTFNVKYPLPKMDMIAIPDFSAGAMENWGNLHYTFQMHYEFQLHFISYTMIDYNYLLIYLFIYFNVIFAVRH